MKIALRSVSCGGSWQPFWLAIDGMPHAAPAPVVLCEVAGVPVSVDTEASPGTCRPCRPAECHDDEWGSE